MFPLRTLPLASAQVDLADRNELFASCDGDEEQQYVYLQLLVNGEQVAEYTDTNPLPLGTVGLAVAAGEVEFDNFVVSQ